MATNAQKLPLAQSIGMAGRQAAQSRVQRLGKVLPCSVVAVNGSIVTVKFEMKADPQTLPHVTMPVFGPEYIRYPIQVGDKGIALSADVFIGQMSGLGTGTADWREPPNLGALVFMPVGNKNWFPVVSNKLVLYGPAGVTIQSATAARGSGGVTMNITASGMVIDLGGTALTIQNGNVTMTGSLTVNGEVMAGATQIHLTTHAHSGVTRGGANTDKPVTGT
jgi:hypothetical protein